ncbi:hypothetical protein GCM10009119_10900 [Algoriphagus jejuensis]|uniref:Outer membrane protein with beta-barrel domain n=1 Tax=Algoriphagus jejuensis TaxID=419934 RepID=A0ABN1MXC8_9BACT
MIVRFTILFFVLVVVQSFGQERSISYSLSNVVDLGGGDFGLITGEVDENTISFITVADSRSEFFSGISVKFHGLEIESEAYLVKVFVYADYKLALYECSKPKNFAMRASKYDFFSQGSNSFATFLDNGISDNQWSVFREPIMLVDITNKIALLRMERQSVFSRGMPVFNERGSIVGMISSKSNDEGLSTFKAIDFSVIEKILYEFEQCKYFKLVPFGQELTVCEKEELEYLLLMKEESKRSRENRRYQFTVSPALSVGIIWLSGTEGNYNYSSFADGFEGGVNLHMRPDERGRLSLKPRYGHYKITEFGLYPSWSSGLRLRGIDFRILKAPITLEYAIKYYRKQNVVIAFGYVPTVKLGTNARVVESGGKQSRLKHNDVNYVNGLCVELSLERRISKWSLIYSGILNQWVDPGFEVEDEFYGSSRPFEGQKPISHYFGVEYSRRLWGNWLLKERTVD